MSDKTLAKLQEIGCKLHKQKKDSTEKIIIEVSGDWNDADNLNATYERKIPDFLRIWPAIQKFWSSEYDIGDLRDIIDDDYGVDDELLKAGFTVKDFEILNDLCPSGAPDGANINSLDITLFYKDETGELYEIR